MSGAEQKSLNFYCSVGARHGRLPPGHSPGRRPEKVQHCPFILYGQCHLTAPALQNTDI